MTGKKIPDIEATGKLTDYELMTEGEHKGHYAARINDVPYPVLSHVDVFLLRLQKGSTVDVLIKVVDGKQWINKITKPKNPAPATTEKPAFTTADKMKAVGFGQPTTGPAKDEVMKEMLARDEEMLAEAQKAIPAPVGGIPGIVAATKANAERLHPVIHPVTFNDDQISLLKAKVAPNATNTEFELLMYLSQKYNLDPLLRQIWLVKFGDSPAQIYAGRDGFLEIAHRSGHFDGMKSDCVYDDGGKLISAWCEVFRNDMTHSFRSSVLLSEYTTGKNLWVTKPSVMLLKCAESICLRKSFSVSGLYAPEEIS